MTAHVLLNLLNELGEKDKIRGFAEHLIGFPPTSLINSIIHGSTNASFYLSYDTKIAFYEQILH